MLEPEGKIIKILIADDHPIFRNGLKSVIESVANYSVVHESDNGEDAFKYICENEIDLAILDVEMPIMDGFEVAKQLHVEKKSLKIIFLTMFKEERFVNKVLDLGVKGYVLKENAVIDILNAIKIVSTGNKLYISPIIEHYLEARNTKAEYNYKESFESLTNSEKKILKLISENKSSKEISELLFISGKTVENHRSNICKKLELTGSNALFKFTVDNKFLIDKMHF
ncbi:MAG: response regulator transcription factor [Bacteroidetes bacterium]|nr:response regulator transcription factor [Bacteroidota bacterium]